LEENFESLEEAKTYARRYVENHKLLEDINTTVPEEKVANYIRQFHNVDKITDTLIESYIELASSNLFSVDPVVVAIKERSAVEFSGKLEYQLADGNIVAINENTQETLNNLLQDKPEIVDYMRESKNNFMRILREI
jgi:predicted double-glycine peptidase